MIEESARVIQVEGEYAWVETHRRGSCGSCSAEKGCGSAAMNRLFSAGPVRVKAHNRIGAAAGEQVVVGLQDAALVRSSLVIYLLPLLTLLAGALAARAAGFGEGLVGLAGLGGLGVGFWWTHLFSRRAAENPLYQAVVLRSADRPFQAAPLHFKK